jgi:hypothetical protein
LTGLLRRLSFAPAARPATSTTVKTLFTEEVATYHVLATDDRKGNI